MQERRKYAQMTVVELKDLLDERSLSKTGKKSDLVSRLEDSDAQADGQVAKDDHSSSESHNADDKTLQETPQVAHNNGASDSQEKSAKAADEEPAESLQEATEVDESKNNGLASENDQKQDPEEAAPTLTQSIVKDIQDSNEHASSPKDVDDTHIDTAVGPSHPQQINTVESAHEAILGTGAEINDAQAVPPGSEIPEAEREVDSVAQKVKSVPPRQGADKDIGADMAITDADLTAEGVDEDKSSLVTNDAEELKRKREVEEDGIENTVTKKLKEGGLKPIGGSALLKEEVGHTDFQLEQARTALQNSPDSKNMNDANEIPRHRETRAIYVANLIRPINSDAFEAHVSALAAEPPTQLYLDPLKTHAYIVFERIQAAKAAKSGLSGQRWPDEPHRKALLVDFVPESSVPEFIKLEKEASKGTKWEVVYSRSNHETVATLRESGTRHSDKKALPPKPNESAKGNAPTRAVKVLKLGDLFKKTTTKPTLYYLPAKKVEDI